MKRAPDKPRKSGYLFVGYENDFEPMRPVTVRLMGKPVSVFLGEDGFFSREMGCKHQGADLSSAPLEGSVVTCARHGWQYDLLTGECKNQNSPPLRAHHVAVEDKAVFVAIFPGDAPMG